MTQRFYTIESAFKNYRELIIPPQAGRAQVEGTERAFYSGAMMMFSTLLAALADPSVDPEVGKAHLDRLKTEIDAYIADQAHVVDAPPPPPITDQSSYNVRSDEVEAVLREVARGLKDQMPKGYGFTVMIFSYGKTGLVNEGDGGSMFYLSTAERVDMLEAMREFIRRNTQ